MRPASPAASAARKNRATTATFPIPTSCRSRSTPDEVDDVRASLGELPAALRQRLETDFGLSAYDADVLVNQGRPVVDYFLDVAERRGDAKAAANWVTQDVLRTLKERDITIDAVAGRQRGTGRPDHENQGGRDSRPAGTRSVSGDARSSASTPQRP